MREHHTLAEMLDALNTPRAALAVMDRGIATEDRVQWLREHRYLVVSRERTRHFDAEAAVRIETASNHGVHLHPAVGPVLDVMAVQTVGGGAAGEAASTVAACKRTAHRRWDAAGSAPDAERLAVGAIHHRDDSGVAAQPSGGLRRDGGAMLDFATSRPAVGEHFGFDMDHDFVAVRRKRRCIAGFEQPLGHPRQRIGAAHGARRPTDERPTWDVGREPLGVFSPVGSGSFPSTGIGGRIVGG